MNSKSNLQSAYDLAKERYAALGVDTEHALAALEKVSISLHCWQGDDVGGFENPGGELTGGTRRRVIILARRVMLMNCAAISTRCTASSPARIA